MHSINKKITLIAICILSVGICVILEGCGRRNDGPRRFDLKGKVTVEGLPLKSGTIEFAPNSIRGNPGPGASAMIVNGEYRTFPGRGIIGGAYFVDIDGEMLASTGDDGSLSDNGSSIQYRLEVDLPTEGGNFDLQIPALDKKKR